MKKTILTLASTLLIGGIAKSQTFEKLFYKDAVKETKDVTITIDNAVSTPAETKFKLKITNKTNDYLIYKPLESKFIIAGKEIKPKEKMLIIKPNESDFVTINLKGTGYNVVKNYSFVFDGLYSVSANGKTISVSDFKLPASQNEFKAGDFNCTMTNITKESDKTEVKFKCSYNGDKIGIIHNTRAGVKMPDGKEYANAKKPGLLESKSKEVLVMKGDEESVNLKWDRMEGGKAMDMQKVPMDIIWNATFTEAPAVKINAETIELEFDEVTTTAKTKK
jgi:transcriptional antiterminator Rof (Rho-off)